MSGEVKFYKAGQILDDPNTNCKSLKSGQLLLLEHPAGQVVDDHDHEEAHIIFVRKGKIEFTIDTKAYAMEVGDTLVVPPKTVHSFKTVGDEACLTACLSI